MVESGQVRAVPVHKAHSLDLPIPRSFRSVRCIMLYSIRPPPSVWSVSVPTYMHSVGSHYILLFAPVPPRRASGAPHT